MRENTKEFSMTTKLDGIIFGENIAHRLSTAMGYDWITSSSGKSTRMW